VQSFEKQHRKLRFIREYRLTNTSSSVQIKYKVTCHNKQIQGKKISLEGKKEYKKGKKSRNQYVFKVLPFFKVSHNNVTVHYPVSSTAPTTIA